MRLFLADDQPNVRHALRVLLEKNPGTLIVGESGSVPTLPEEISLTKPDILIIEWLLLKNISKNGMRKISDEVPGLKMIVMSSRPELEPDAKNAGAHAFISKIDPPDKLLEAVSSYRKKPVS